MNAWLLSIALTVPAGYQAAPVYEQLSESVFKRAGTYIYRPTEEGYTVIFCIVKTPVMLRCAVSTPADMMVIIDAQASEQGS